MQKQHTKFKMKRESQSYADVPLYNRFVRWSRLGVFNRIFEALASKGGKPDRLMIDATHLKAHRTAASLTKKGLFPAVLGERRAA
jgi:putative transposase